MLAAMSVLNIATPHMHVLSAVSPAEAEHPKALYHPLVACDTQSHQPIRAHSLFLSLFMEKQHP